MLYEDLVSKLGASATGNEARFDNDSESHSVQPPTDRLRKRLHTDMIAKETDDGSQSETDDASISTASTVISD